MSVERSCHICGAPIRGKLAYARAAGHGEGRHRVYAHPECYFQEVPEGRRAAYHRERLATDERHGPRSTGPPGPTDQAERERDAEDPPSGEPVVEVDGLSKTYPDGTEAVREVSFTVHRGEIFGLLGPNGAGKSTLIGMLGTLVEPTAGTGRVAGFDVEEAPDRIKPKLGFAMQEIGVDELATGREFLQLQARLYGLEAAEARRRTDELLAAFDIEDAADKRIDGYSGGMQRRIDLAGALIHEPEIVFLDEPTEGLDPRGRREMWELVRSLNDELDATILLSTHYMEEADALCDRLAILDRGEVVVQGRPEQLKDTVGQESVQLSWDQPHDTGLLEAAEALIVEEGLAEAVQRSDGDLHAYVEDPARAIPPLLRRLETAGLAPQSLSVKEASLDDVYLAYTGRSMAAAEQEGRA